MATKVQFIKYLFREQIMQVICAK